MEKVISLHQLAGSGITAPFVNSANVVLINMPFASTCYPSLSLSTLKAQASQQGHSVTVKNYNLLFAHMIGLDGYETLAGGSSDLLGEQIFAQLVHPERSGDPDFTRFIEQYISIDQFDKLVSRTDEFLQCCSAELASYDADLFGFTTTFYQKMASVALSDRLKKLLPDTPVIFGGAACEMPMGKALMQDYLCVDYVIHGEADDSFPSFVSHLADGRTIEHIPGLCFRDKQNTIRQTDQSTKSTDLNTLAIPDYRDFEEQVAEYDFGPGFSWQYSFESSRGCWWGQKHHCTFCGLNGNQMKFRSKDAGRVLKQLSTIAQNEPNSRIQFSDNILNYKFVDELVPKLGSVGNLRYFFEVKANLKPKQVHALASNRVLEVQPGIERLCDNTLRLMQKGTSSKQNIQVLRWCADHGIKAIWNVLYGFAGENANDVIREANLYRQLFHLPPPESCAPIRIDRYSPNHTRSTELGYSLTGPSMPEQFMHYGSDRIDDLAYHFDYVYSDPDHHSGALTDAWSTLKATVSDWQQAHRPASLRASYQANEVVIQDLRKNQSCEWLLKGINADIYRHLQKFRKRRDIEQTFRNCSQSLDSMIEKELIIQLDDWLMAAAIGCSCDQPLNVDKTCDVPTFNSVAANR